MKETKNWGEEENEFKGENEGDADDGDRKSVV